MKSPTISNRTERPSWHLVLVALTSVKLAIHLIVNLQGGYGIFRDELYYLACANHLDVGYVDHPPLSIWLLAAVRTVLGDSLFSIRLIPAVAGAALVYVTGRLAREMGGGRLAVALAALCPLVAPQVLGVSTVWSMNVFDLLFVALAAWAWLRLVATGEPRWWIALGLALGLGLANKVGVLWVGLGFAVATVTTHERRWLATRWPWVGGLLAAAAIAPYVVWNATHDWAHLEFIESAVSGKYSGLSAWTFLSGQLLRQNPTTLFVWVAGLAFLLVAPAGRRFRGLGFVWLTACVVLLANGQSKAGYLANAYAPLFAAGGVAWERWLPARRWVRGAALGVVASGLALAPMALPILPVTSYVDYAAWLGAGPSTDEGHDLAELPQFYADMFGWREKAEAVAAVAGTLSADERRRSVVYSANYGRAGAIDYYRRELDLPPSVSGHNTYWFWGPHASDDAVFIVLGGDRSDLERRFESVELAGVATCRFCIPYERDLQIFVGRRLKLPMDELWPAVRHYD